MAKYSRGSAENRRKDQRRSAQQQDHRIKDTVDSNTRRLKYEKSWQETAVSNYEEENESF